MSDFFSNVSPECYVVLTIATVIITGVNYLFWWRWTAERIKNVQCPIPQAAERLASHGCHSCARYFDECICPPVNQVDIKTDLTLD